MPVGTPEPKRSAFITHDSMSILVHGAVMVAAQQDQIRECRRAALGPVVDVMRLDEPVLAAWEAARLVAMQ